MYNKIIEINSIFFDENYFILFNENQKQKKKKRRKKYKREKIHYVKCTCKQHIQSNIYNLVLSFNIHSKQTSKESTH